MRGARLLSLASFRFSSRWTPLPRTMRFPLSGRARDFHPLDYAHVGRTKKRAGQLAVVRLLGGSDLLSHFRSTIGAVRFNFSVRNGKRWNPHAITTLVSFSPLCVRCVKVRSFLEVQNAVSLGLSCRLKRHRCHSIRAPGFALPSRV